MRRRGQRNAGRRNAINFHAPAHAPAPDLAFPSLDLRALVRRAALPTALAGVAVVAVIVAGGPPRTLADALVRPLDADPRWVGVVAVFELLSFGGYVALLWLVGGRATRQLGTPREH